MKRSLGTLHWQFSSGYAGRLGAFTRLDVGQIESKAASENLKKYETLKSQYVALMKQFDAGGGERAIDRHVNRNKKLLVRDRLQRLFDDMDSVLELSSIAGFEMEYGTIPKAGNFTGIGRIHGVECLVLANDATVKGGTMYPITVRIQLRAQEIAQENSLPCVYLVDSGGAFLPLQADIFTPGGRVFYNEAIMNSKNIPQLAVVCGSCTAGAAYVPTMSQEASIVDKIGTIFLGGPPLVYAALGEVVTPEKLGGAKIHSNVSGYTDYYAETEDEAFRNARSCVAAFNIDANSTCSYTEPEYGISDIGTVIPHREQHSMDSYQVIARILDASRFHEFKATYGCDMVTGFGFLQGMLIGVVANNGACSARGAEKAAHFTQLCTQRAVPMVFLQNTSPQTTLSPAEAGDLMRAQAKMMSAVACSTVPKITVITGNSFGIENPMMCGRSFGPRFMFSWPNAQIGITDTSGFRNNLGESSVSSEDIDLLTQQFVKNSTAFHAAAHLWDDGVILPEDTRKVLGRCLSVFHQQRSNSWCSDVPASVMRM